MLARIGKFSYSSQKLLALPLHTGHVNAVLCLSDTSIDPQLRNQHSFCVYVISPRRLEICGSPSNHLRPLSLAQLHQLLWLFQAHMGHGHIAYSLTGLPMVRRCRGPWCHSTRLTRKSGIQCEVGPLDMS